MVKLRSDLLQAIVGRGYLHQCTDLPGLDELASERRVVGYIGFDCTAPSLHVGSLVPIMLLRRMQQTDHQPIVLLGGGTTRIGDPSGKDTTRQLLSDADIAANMAGIKRVFERFLRFGDGPSDAIMIDNGEWLGSINYVDFLRDYGRHFSVNRMLSFESVKLRLEREQPLSFIEFNYMVLQAYDFVELARRFECMLQMGGSDQWGNIVSGVDLGRRVDNRELFGLTAPLITTASGSKMGKTAAGAIWLNPERLSDFDYWQFWRNSEDEDVGRFLRLFTDLPLDQIEKLERLGGAEINEAKKVLANEATALCRGAAAAAAAADTARRTFEQGGTGEALPTVELSRAEMAKGIAAFELFHRAGLASSNAEARRLIRAGGAKVNDGAIASETEAIGLDCLDAQGVVKLSAGKKRHALIRVV